jgi:hypothetical protein
MEFVASHPDDHAFGVLNACRVLYSVRTHDVVVSKYEVGQWAREQLEVEWRPIVAAAVRDYSGTPTPSDAATLAQGWTTFVTFVRTQLARP